jgi:hypothetical protein
VTNIGRDAEASVACAHANRARCHRRRELPRVRRGAPEIPVHARSVVHRD